MSKKVIIYLADLANTKFGYSPSTVPVTVGYIKAYAVSQLSNEVDIQIHRTFESLYEAIQTKKPDIIGCAWYGWNRYLTLNALTYIKSNFPDIITVVGGPNVPDKPEDCLRDFKEFPCIDIMIPNEGEIPFVNFLKVFIGGGKTSVFKTAIDGVFYVSDGQEQARTGKVVPPADDINIFPSPYLHGYLDQFLDNEELTPVLQTMRGCPFRCSYCVSGKDSWNKVRAFDTERVKAEINYLETRAKNKILRFTDENFGIFPRDLELAKFIADKRGKTDYPIAFRGYTYRNINDRIKQIALLFKNLIPLNISYQTLTKSILGNIGRKNLDIDKLRDVINWAHKNDIDIKTEVIFGLPGETYNSFMNTIALLIELRFDNVEINSLMMLKQIGLNHPGIIYKYGYKILYSGAERGYTRVGLFENVEIDAWVVESNMFSFKEYITIQLVRLIYNLFIFWGYFKEMVYIWENRSVKMIDVISELIDRHSCYPFFSQQLIKLKNCFQENMFNTPEKVQTVFRKRFLEASNSEQHIGVMSPFFSMAKVIAGEMIHISNQETTINEVVKASITVFDKCGKGSRVEFLNELQFAKHLVKRIIVSFWEVPQKTTILSSPYDLIAWRNQDYRGVLSQFVLSNPTTYQLRINSLTQYIDFIHKHSTKPFCVQSEIFFREFRTINMRRCIVR